MRYVSSQRTTPQQESDPMDVGIIAAIGMLVLWGVGTFAFEAPGYIHILLTAGVFLLVWRIVKQQDAAIAKGRR